MQLFRSEMGYTEICKAQLKSDPEASCVVFTSAFTFTQSEGKTALKYLMKKGQAIEETKHSCLFPQDISY